MNEKVAEDLAPTSNVEAPFSLDELFFSRTDKRGVIQSGNAVFQRVSEHGWDQLINAPHKVIRHPDMPRAVFQLFWERIQAGKPTGAYVKNRSKSGKYYWVYAIVSSVDGGYLSVRLKPTSELLAVVKKEYAAIRACELRDGLDPTDGVAMLLSRLNQLGWRDYDSFMSHALMVETKARDTSLHRENAVIDQSAMALLDVSGRNLKEAEDILRNLRSISLFPVNMRVVASHLSERGKQFAVISQNYGEICEGIQSRMRDFVEASQDLSAQINACVFLSGAARYQNEIAAMFDKEDSSDNQIDTHHEAAVLRGLSTSYDRTLRASASSVSSASRKLHRTCNQMQSLVRGLQMARTMGKIETARLDGGGVKLDAMIDRLSEFQVQITGNLSTIEKLNKSITGSLGVLLGRTQTAA